MKINTLLKSTLLLVAISGLLFSCVPSRKFEDVKALDETKRGSGGFGSTGRR